MIPLRPILILAFVAACASRIRPEAANTGGDVAPRFDAKSRGHFGMWSGSLDSVTRYEMWNPPPAPLVFEALPGSAGDEADDSLVIVIDRPTVVAYFALTKAELDSGAEEALSDFQFYLPAARDSLARLGVAFRAQSRDTVVYRDGGVINRWLPAPDSAKVGYVFLVPGEPPRAKYGVDTDTGLREWVAGLLKAARGGGS